MCFCTADYTKLLCATHTLQRISYRLEEWTKHVDCRYGHNWPWCAAASSSIKTCVRSKYCKYGVYFFILFHRTSFFANKITCFFGRHQQNWRYVEKIRYFAYTRYIQLRRRRPILSFFGHGGADDSQLWPTTATPPQPPPISNFRTC